MRETRGQWLKAAMHVHLRSRRWRVWAVLVTGLAVALCFMPLLGLLGFGFAFVMAFAVSIAAVDLGASLVRRARAIDAHAFDQARSPAALVGALWYRSSQGSLLLLVIPLALISLNAFRVRNCDFLFGIKAFVAMPVLSVIYGAGVGVALGIAAGTRKKLSNALPAIFVLTAAAASIISFYSSPPVFFYNPMIGYFPGNLYDETIEFYGAFAWARLFHFSLLGTFLAAAAAFLDVPSLRLRRRRRRPQGSRRASVGVSVVLATTTLLLWSQSSELGFHASASDIQQALGGHHQTKNFDIYYPLGGEVAAHIERIADDHEFRYAQVARDLEVQTEQRITSYYFDSNEEKHRHMGARRVHMAKPWRQEIYVSDQSFPHEIIRHEIAHAVASEFGSAVFRVSAKRVLGMPLAFNPGLIEGLAVAVDWPNHFRQALTPHESVKAMLELGLAPPARRVLSTQFFAYSGARSYTTAGSFLRFILDAYGTDKLRELYRTGGDFEAVFGRSQETLVTEWNRMIDTIVLEEGAAARVRERFRRASVFQRPCPHYVARANARVGQQWALGDEDGAIETWRRVCKLVPQEPRYWLNLADLYTRANKSDAARPILERIAADSEKVTSTLRAKALIELSLTELDRGADALAKEHLELAAKLPLPDDEGRNVHAMLWVLSHHGAASAPLRRYFFGGRDIEGHHRSIVMLGWAAQAIAAAPDNALGHYLLGRNLHGRGAPESTVVSLTRSLDLGLPHPLLTRECARLLASAAYLAGDQRALERAAGILLAPSQPRVLRLYGLDWLERLHWKRYGRVPAPRLTLETWRERLGDEFPVTVDVLTATAPRRGEPPSPGLDALSPP